MKLFLGIDGGGTSTDACIISEGGSIISFGKGGPSNIYFTPHDQVVASVEEAVNSATIAAKETHKDLEISYACVALSGAGRQGDIEKASLMIKPILGQTPFRVVEDTKAALHGALGGKEGIVVISGTGSNCLGFKDAKYARSGGWGALLGDEGSSYRIAVLGLTAALRSYDGRTSESSLTKRFTSCFNICAPDDILPFVHKLTRPEIAGLSSIIFEESLKGDRVADSIIKSETLELVEMVKAVYSKLGFSGTTKVATVGGSFRQAQLADGFAQKLKKAIPGAVAKKPLHSPTVGAALLARDSVIESII